MAQWRVCLFLFQVLTVIYLRNGNKWTCAKWVGMLPTAEVIDTAIWRLTFTHRMKSRGQWPLSTTMWPWDCRPLKGLIKIGTGTKGATLHRSFTSSPPLTVYMRTSAGWITRSGEMYQVMGTASSTVSKTNWSTLDHHQRVLQNFVNISFTSWTLWEVIST